MSVAQEQRPALRSQPGPALKADSTATGVARKVARKAAAMTDSLAQSGAKAGEQMTQTADASRTPADIAEQGFSGTPTDLPHRSKMEQSFGMSFDFVQFYADDKAQKANSDLGSNAYAMGTKIASSTPNPSPQLIAHELTHVLQQTGKGGKKVADNGDGGIEATGEEEAEQVEAAVGGGENASKVLGGTMKATPEQQSGSAKVEAGGGKAGPALKSKGGPGPALDSRYTNGMAFSASGFEKSHQYALWDLPKIEAPIAAVPGLNLLIEPSVKVKAGLGVDWTQGALKIPVGLEGGVLLGFSYGNTNVAALYGGLECTLGGGFEYEKSANSWKFGGQLKLSSNFTIGCKIAGGILDFKFDFGKVDPICIFGQLGWENGRFSAGGFSWGQQVLDFFAGVRRCIARATELINAGAEAARRTLEAARRTGREAYNVGRDVVNWATSW